MIDDYFLIFSDSAENNILKITKIRLVSEKEWISLSNPCVDHPIKCLNGVFYTL